MTYSRSLRRWRQLCAKTAACIAATLLVASACAAQATRTPPTPPPDAPWLTDINKNPILQAELKKLILRLQDELQSPTPRSESRLLPFLPASTTVYAAFPNYGGLVHQTLAIFRDELQHDPALRIWWQHGDMAKAGPKVEGALDTFSQLSQYLGDEVVLSSAMELEHPKLIVMAEVRKPGLRPFLQQLLAGLGKSNSFMRVLDPRELAAAAPDSASAHPFVVLVRPDFVIAASDLASLRNFNAALDRGSGGFAGAPFGHRVQLAYNGGVTGLLAADVHSILGRVPPGPNHLTFQRTGFADMNYLVWRHNFVAGRAMNDGELSFTGPRQGAASWLASPAPLGSLDFVSPNAILAGSILLAKPAKMFDDITQIAAASNSNPFAALAQFEQALNVNLKQDLLARLTGEITLELDDATSPQPAWRAIVGVNDASHLQQTLKTLLAAAHMVPDQSKDGALTYYKLLLPSAKAPLEINYAFAGGYLIVGSTHGEVTEAIGSHTTGESLGRSKNFLASLPPGHSTGVSALLYQDPTAMAALQLKRIAPDMAGSLVQLMQGRKPQVLCLYGEETAIREASTSAGFDAGAILVGAAVAIPNLLRSRIAANEASAIATLRTAVTAEVTYASTYPERGFAPDLATLGSAPRRTPTYNPAGGGFIDASLGNASCLSGAWCTKSGFRFSLTAGCREKLCTDFVIVGTPVSADTGGRSFCSTSDGVIRFKVGEPLPSPFGVSECQAWPPLH